MNIFVYWLRSFSHSHLMRIILSRKSQSTIFKNMQFFFLCYNCWTNKTAIGLDDFLRSSHKVSKSCKNYGQTRSVDQHSNKIRRKIFLLQFDWFDFKQWLWYDWSIACTDKQRERNVVQKKAAVCWKERYVTSLKMAAKETNVKWVF